MTASFAIESKKTVKVWKRVLEATGSRRKKKEEEEERWRTGWMKERLLSLVRLIPFSKIIHNQTVSAENTHTVTATSKKASNQDFSSGH